MSSEMINLRQAGLKVTQPRLKILQLFANSKKRHLSIDDVCRILKKTNKEIGVATIYRVLAQFESSGILRRSNLNPYQSFYELDADDNHVHMLCIKCGSVEEFYDADVEKNHQFIISNNGAKLIKSSIVIYVICKNCQ